MKDHLATLVSDAVTELAASGTLALPTPLPAVTIEPCKNPSHGDFSTNIAMLLAKPCRLPPVAIAQLIAGKLSADSSLKQVTVAPPGFINFRLQQSALFGVVGEILQDPAACGQSTLGARRKIQIEFVSANPTGPLHVGHGRGAAYGAALVNLLRAAGYDVTAEYYVNDAGRQMDILALSVWLRYLEHLNVSIALPDNAYRGEYVKVLATALAERDGTRYLPTSYAPPALSDPATAEAYLDTFITYCQQQLGDALYRALHAFGCDSILNGINEDLRYFGVEFDNWYSERSLSERDLLTKAVAKLANRGFIYAKDGAQWFRSSDFGDEKDRVVVRDNGQPTYFASDIAYHADKFARGFEHVINIWGADHHGYIPRVKAALSALNEDPNRLEILLVQFASLYRAGQKVQMSTRSGEFVTLRELVDEVGVDAARFFYTSRRSDQHLDFDLDLAKAQSQDNPVYYLQYAHARICSVFRQLTQLGGNFDQAGGIAALHRLGEAKEIAVVATLGRYAETVAHAATQREPHALANYLRELATDYHAFYNQHKIIVDDEPLRQARLALCGAARVVLADGLKMLGVSAPQEM